MKQSERGSGLIREFLGAEGTGEMVRPYCVAKEAVVSGEWPAYAKAAAGRLVARNQSWGKYVASLIRTIGAAMARAP